MSRPGLSQQDVFDLANKLRQEGREPTIESIRAAFGTGSNTTISKHLREWRELHVSRQGRAVSKIPQALLFATESIWEQAMNLAEQGALHLKEEAKREVEESNQTLQEEQKKVQSIAAKLKEAESNLQQQNQHNEQFRLELEHERQESAVLKAQIAAFEQNRDQQQQEIAKLHQLSSSLQKNWEHLQRISQEQQEKLKAELEALRQHSDHQIKLLTSNVQALMYEKSSLHNQVGQLQSENAQHASEILDLHKEVQRRTSEFDAATQQLNSMNGQLQLLQKTLNGKESDLHIAQIKLAESDKAAKNFQQENRQLKGQLQLIESKNNELVAEKHNLEGRLHQLQEFLTISRAQSN